jgi:hypothetical protein
MSGMVLPMDCSWEPRFPLLLSAPLLVVFDGGISFLIIEILLVVPFLFSSKLLRILQLRGLHQMHLGGMRGNCNNLSTSSSSQ